MSGNRHLSFPFRIGSEGRAQCIQTMDEHVREEIIQLLLTNPEERLFLPEFGAGIKLYVFSNFDDHSAVMAKTALTQCISRWLGERITLEGLEMKMENETLNIRLVYRVIGSDESGILSFQRTGDGYKL